MRKGYVVFCFFDLIIMLSCQTCLECNYEENGITYIEENKSTVPDSLFEERNELKQDFTYYEKLLDSLIQNDIHNPGYNWGSETFYTVKVIEVFGDYAVGKLHTKNKPWAKIKVGHKLRMHK